MFIVIKLLCQVSINKEHVSKKNISVSFNCLFNQSANYFGS
jgi:hypothetical protein